MSDELQQELHASGMELASISKRLYAAVIDNLLISLVFMFIIYEQIQGMTDFENIVLYVNQYTLEYMFITVLYQTVFVAQYGASIGKIALKIRVIEQDTLAQPSIARALNRAVFRVISESVLYIGFVWALFSKNRVTWHDITAKTLVVDA